MPIFAPDLNNNGKKERKGRAIRPDRSLERRYRQRLFRVNRTLQDEYLTLGRLIRDGMINQADALKRLDQVEEALAQRGVARGIAEGVVNNADETNRDRMQNMFKNMFGIDVFGIVDDLGLRGQLEGMIEENVGLITSIPRDSIQRARNAVTGNFRGETLPGGSLLQELQRIGNITKNRARLIARDQTSKLNSSINQARQQAVGIEEYIWRNSRDERVVGNPSGLYPKGNRKHLNHWDREGKKFKWSEPPPDGHPGIPIQCRCRAEPVIDLDKLKRI
jgi:SPP1 gp7 family putative phage head morphogenesis protein